MLTLDIKNLAKTAKGFSCDEDFNPYYMGDNYPKLDHNKKWHRTHAKLKVELMDDLAERSPNGEPLQVSDNTNIELTADIYFLIEKLLNNSTEQDRKIIALLSEGYNQSEIAEKLGISQSTVSRKISKFR